MSRTGYFKRDFSHSFKSIMQPFSSRIEALRAAEQLAKIVCASAPSLLLRYAPSGLSTCGLSRILSHPLTGIFPVLGIDPAANLWRIYHVNDRVF